MEVNGAAHVTPDVHTQSEQISPESVLHDYTLEPEAKALLGKRPKRSTSESAVNFLLLKISDQYKEKKRHLKMAKLAEVNLRNLIEEVQDIVYGYEFASEDDE